MPRGSEASGQRRLRNVLRDALTVERLSENAADTMFFVGAYGIRHRELHGRPAANAADG